MKKTENRIYLNASDIKELRNLQKTTTRVMSKYGKRDVQSARFRMDAIAGDIVGVECMNDNLHGYDGFFPGDIPFENKNTKSSAKSQTSYGICFRDITAQTMSDIKDGNIGLTNSHFGTGDTPDWMLVGCSKFIKDNLLASYDEKNRKSSNVGLKTCLEKGFKIVALNMDKEQVLDVLSLKFPKLAKSFSFDDVLDSKEEAQAFVASIL